MTITIQVTVKWVLKDDSTMTYVQTGTIINLLVPFNTYIEARQVPTHSRNASRSRANIQPS